MAPSERKAQEKELKKLMEKLKDAVVLVEGKKDEQSLEPYVRNGKILQAASGRLQKACERASELGVREVVVLTDRDKAGEELAKMAKDELERHGIRADLDVRKTLMAMLRLAYVENFGKKYEEKIKELEEKKKKKKKRKQK
ncbi:MAG: toprim domain-containing protein [bacterium]|nr:toprim domain-containing protein [bacterium]